MALVLLTADEILYIGLDLVGFSRRQQQNVCRPTNVMRFKGHYGSNPIVYAQILEELQTTAIPEARIDVRKSGPLYFLMAVHFLARYPTEQEQAGIFKVCDKTARCWSWYFATKIQMLKEEKVNRSDHVTSCVGVLILDF